MPLLGVPGMWVSIYPHHAAGQTLMAKVAGGIPLPREIAHCLSLIRQQ